MVLICDGKTLKLTSLDGVHTVREELAEIDSTQDKSDSRVVLYGLYTKNQGNKNVSLKSPDTESCSDHTIEKCVRYNCFRVFFFNE